MCGFSGLPKLRQLVRPSGSAPTHARLRAHSSTASTAPVYGIAGHAPAVAVDRHRDRAAAAVVRELEHRGVGRLRPAHGARADDASRTARTRSAWRPRSASPSSGQQRALRVGVLAEARRRIGIDALGGLLRLQVVERAVVHQRRDRHVAHHLVAVEHPQPLGVGDLADGGGAHLPALADLEQLGQPPRLDHAEHPLLGLRDHDLEGLHVRLAQRHLRHVDVEAHAALRRHLGRARGEAGRAEVLERHQHAPVEQLEAAFEHPLLLEGIADLHASGAWRSPPRDSSALASTEAPPMPSRPVRAPMSTSRLPDAGGGAADHRALAGEAHAHRVHEAVLLVGGLEQHLAAHGGHADRVAVVADALDRPVEQVARALRVELAEAQRVEHGDRPGADREHVAQDAAHAGGGALERLDRARVVVGLDLERHHEAVAHVHRAGVLARAHDHVRSLGRAAGGAASSSACRRSARTT